MYSRRCYCGEKSTPVYVFTGAYVTVVTGKYGDPSAGFDWMRIEGSDRHGRSLGSGVGDIQDMAAVGAPVGVEQLATEATARRDHDARQQQQKQQ